MTRPRMRFLGQLIVPGRTISHYGDWDTLLVRVGHHLWKSRKRYPQDHAIQAALEDVWRVKREYRAPMVAKRLAKQGLAKNIKREVAA